jgi:hypothetical protein
LQGPDVGELQHQLQQANQALAELEQVQAANARLAAQVGRLGYLTSPQDEEQTKAGRNSDACAAM